MAGNSSPYLSGTHSRARLMRQDVANILKRFFLCEQALIINQGAWLPAIAPLEVKLALPHMLWEDALAANDLRHRLFELRFPSRALDVDDDAALVHVFEETLHAPSPEAFILALARVFKPALLQAYQQYVTLTDELADGPTLRFLRQVIWEKRDQVQTLTRYAGKMLVTNPTRRAAAETWVTELNRRLIAVGGLIPTPSGQPIPSTLPTGRRPFTPLDTPARDEQFHLCRFYWPDIIDPTFAYGDGFQLQLRSAISHFNEVWAVETAGYILHAFARQLGWEFVFDAARWVYDESRHCRMGYERLRTWGFKAKEIPLGSYIYDSAQNQHPIYRLGMLYHFETKNIGHKSARANTFAQYEDQLSQHDMEFDWADEAIHATFGRRWLTALHNLQSDTLPALATINTTCHSLVANTIKTATDAEREDIHTIAQAMITKAEMKIGEPI